MPRGSNTVYLGWRMVSEYPTCGYNVYRKAAGGSYEKRNASPILGTTDYADNVTDGQTYYYIVRLVDGSGIESPDSNEVSLVANGSTSLIYRQITDVWSSDLPSGIEIVRTGDVDGDDLMDFVLTGYPRMDYDTSEYRDETANGPETVKVYLHDGSLAWELLSGWELWANSWSGRAGGEYGDTIPISEEKKK